MATLTTQDLAIGYQKGRRSSTIVGENINVSLNPGEFVCLIGPNGVGKSTLMRTLAGMQRPLSGTVLLNNHDIHQLPAQQLAQLLSIVLTERIDVGMLSAYALVALGRHPHTKWGGQLSAEDEEIVQEAILAVGAKTLAHRYVNELSDGERQKIMIARALAQEPQLMILDEPTAFLDLPHRVEVMQILRQLAHEQKRSILLSTHDLDLALRTADKIWLMAENQPLQMGIPEDLVLNRAFSNTFDSQSIAFNLQNGTFQICQPRQGKININGEGLGVTWLARALEREGFEAVRDNGRLPIQVTILEDKSKLKWQIQANDQRFIFNSIQATIEKIKSLSRLKYSPF